MAANKTYQFKLVLLGDTSVGKSSIVIRFVKGQFSEYQESTIGGMFVCVFVFCMCVFKINNKQKQKQ